MESVRLRASNETLLFKLPLIHLKWKSRKYTFIRCMLKYQHQIRHNFADGSSIKFCTGAREEGSESAPSRKSPTACHMHLPSNSKSISLEALLCNGFCLKRNLHCPPFQFSLSSPSDYSSLLVSSLWWVIWGVNCSVLLCPVRFERKHWEATLRCQHAHAHRALHGAAMLSCTLHK